jgi:hypothetical protein
MLLWENVCQLSIFLWRSQCGDTASFMPAAFTAGEYAMISAGVAAQR